MPPAFVVLAYAGATLDTLAKELSVLAQQDSDPWIGIDAVCVLNRGIVSWIEPGTSVMFQRMPGSMVFSSSTTPGNVLLSFVTSLNDLLSRARYNERFNIKAYIKGAMGDMSGFWKDGDRYEGISSGEGRQVLRKIDE